MSDTAISVADAARDFLRVLDTVEPKRGTAVLVRDGKPVATLNPILEPAQTAESSPSDGPDWINYHQKKARHLQTIWKAVTPLCPR